jgi:hypothetical protein
MGFSDELTDQLDQYLNDQEISELEKGEKDLYVITEDYTHFFFDSNEFAKMRPTIYQEQLGAIDSIEFKIESSSEAEVRAAVESSSTVEAVHSLIKTEY